MTLTAIHAADVIRERFNNGGKVLVCGNGGSAAEAGHFCAELLGRFKVDRRPLPCINLCACHATITAIGNDYGFENVFQRQVEALGTPEDVLVTFSTSGKSLNVLKAIDSALRIGMKIIEAPIEPAWQTDRIQEMQLQWLHAVAARLEEYALGQANV